MKFRKKPVVIEAMPFDGTELSAACIFMEFDIPGARFVASKSSPDPAEGMIGVLTISPLDGDITASGNWTARAGDWIIKGANGQFHPCKPDIFEATYESAEYIEPEASWDFETIRQWLDGFRWGKYPGGLRRIDLDQIASKKTGERVIS